MKSKQKKKSKWKKGNVSNKPIKAHTFFVGIMVSGTEHKPGR